jgi:hypothetical protein
MRKTLVEFGHTHEIQPKPIYGIYANNLKKNTAQNGVIPYWIARHGPRHTPVPEELSEHNTHYIRLIMSGAYDNPTKNILTSIASGPLAFQDHSRVRDQLTATHLDFFGVYMSRAVEKMVYTFAHFRYRMLDGLHGIMANSYSSS